MYSLVAEEAPQAVSIAIHSLLGSEWPFNVIYYDTALYIVY